MRLPTPGRSVERSWAISTGPTPSTSAPARLQDPLRTRSAAPSRCRFRPMTSTSGDPTQLTLTELGAAYRARQLSPVEATRACLERIARLDAELHAFITVTGELALDQARAAQ